MTIQAKVNTRLLSKASRLFTGTLAGRIIEILQNARRAGAQHVQIGNHDGVVTIRDDGRGIDDFAKLLDLGASGWNDNIEASEDPAGVGLFCLAPRQLMIRSSGKRLTISGQGWTGAAVTVEPDPQPLPSCPLDIGAGSGTELSFQDEPWELAIVEPLAAFTGMEVTVDGQGCPKQPFIKDHASTHPQLGCRIQVAVQSELTSWHRAAAHDRHYGSNVLVNFHGQVVSFAYHPVSKHDLFYLVDMTGEPSAIRLMLPARTCLVENDALGQLKLALELEAFKHLKSQGHHRLPYKEYLLIIRGSSAHGSGLRRISDRTVTQATLSRIAKFCEMQPITTIAGQSPTRSCISAPATSKPLQVRSAGLSCSPMSLSGANAQTARG